MRQGINKAICSMVIGAACEAYRRICNLSFSEAMRHAGVGKGDTLVLDYVPESVIVEAIERFDRRSTVIAEERGFVYPKDRELHGHDPTFVYFIDPIDGSEPTEALLKTLLGNKSGTTTLGELLSKPSAIKLWERDHGTPASVTGPHIGISCLAYGLPILSVHVNVLTAELFVQCRSGLYNYKLPHFDSPSNVDHTVVVREGRRISYQATVQNGCEKRFIAYMGKDPYEQNMRASGLFGPDDPREFLLKSSPSGPARFLYLTELFPESIGTVIFNGEKISESMPSIVAARHARHEGSTAFRLFEMVFETPTVYKGTLMGTTRKRLAAYSSLQPDSGNHGCLKFDDKKLIRDFPENPSHYRSSMMLCPAGNSWAISQAHTLGWREVIFPDN